MSVIPLSHASLLAVAALGLTPAVARQAPRVPAATTPTRIILFVGNSFTQGAHSVVKCYGAATVTGLNAAGCGGVPALLKAFADQAG